MNNPNPRCVLPSAGQTGERDAKAPAASFIPLTRDQAAILCSMARGGNMWVCQDEMAALADLGLTVIVDRCPLTLRHKYAVTDAGREEAKRREMAYG